MDVLIIGFSSSSTDSAKLPGYQAELQQSTDGRVLYCYFDELSIEVAPGKFEIFDHRNARPLDSYGLVVFRGAVEKMYLANAVCQFLHERHVRFMNDYRTYKAANKLLQAIDFYKQQVPFPATLYCAGRKQFLELIRERNQYPVIVKSVAGSQGKDNFCINTAAELAPVKRLPASLSFIAQAFIPNDYDYRILFVGSERLVIQRTGPANSHLNNLSQGATIHVVAEETLPAEVLAQAAELVKNAQLTLAGVDVIVTPDSHYFLEVNSQPGWRTLEDEVAPLLRKLLTRH